MNTQENQAAQDDDSTLGAQRLQAVELLAGGMNMRAAAAKLKVSERSLRRWKNEPEFANELHASIREVLDEIKLKVNPLILRAEKQAKRIFKINDELLESTDYRIVSKACNSASVNAIRWIKLLLVLEKARTASDLAAVVQKLERAGDPVPQASSLHDPDTHSASEPVTAASVSPAPSSERGPGGEVAPERAPVSVAAAASAPCPNPKSANETSVSNVSESGQKRTSEKPAPSVQPQAAPSVKPSAPAPKPMSAPGIVVQASSLRDKSGDTEGERVIAEAAAAVISRKFARTV